MKAYKTADGKTRLFRPRENAVRLNRCVSRDLSEPYFDCREYSRFLSFLSGALNRSAARVGLAVRLVFFLFDASSNFRLFLDLELIPSPPLLLSSTLSSLTAIRPRRLCISPQDSRQDRFASHPSRARMPLPPSNHDRDSPSAVLGPQRVMHSLRHVRRCLYLDQETRSLTSASPPTLSQLEPRRPSLQPWI